jgi:hypothetical protein
LLIIECRNQINGSCISNGNFLILNELFHNRNTLCHRSLRGIP